jgi:hypothetical protein
MSTILRRALLVTSIGTPCPLLRRGDADPRSTAQPDHIHPRSRGGTLAVDNRAVVCFPCNRDKGSLSLGRFLYQLCRNGDPRAGLVETFMRERGVPLDFPRVAPPRALCLGHPERLS